MNKVIALASLFLFNICAAQEESLALSAECNESISSEITESTELIASEVANTQTECEAALVDVTSDVAAIENVEETAVTDFEICPTESQEIATCEEITTSSLIFDFIAELESLDGDWADFFTTAKTMNSRCAEDKVNTQEALNLALAIYDYASQLENKGLGIISASLYETNNFQETLKTSAPNSISIRFTVVRTNESHPELWAAMQELAQVAQTVALQAATTNCSEQEIQATETAIQEHPVIIIASAAQALISLIESDDNNSVSTQVAVHAETNNVVE